MTWTIAPITSSSVTEGGSVTFRLSRNHTGVETVYLSTWQNWNSSGVYNGKDYSGGPTNTAGPDYSVYDVSVNFGAAHTYFDFTIYTLDNNSVYEPSETFGIVARTLGNWSANAANFLAFSSFTILDNDAVVTPPRISIANASANEGNNLVFTVSLLDGRVADRDITVYFHTTPGTASQTAGGDYYHSANGYGTTVIRAGTNSATISVTTYANGDADASETMTVVLDSVSYGTRANTSATGTIYNTDVLTPPRISIANTTANEGNDLAFTVSLLDGRVADRDITVYFHTTPGTASQTAGGDYYHSANGYGTTVIRTGTNSATISVTTYANGDADASETMSVVLDSVSYGTRANTSAIGTIYNTDVTPPRISIANTSANEGSNLAFTVSLLDGRVADRDITVSFHTTPGTASQAAGGDYYHSANGYGTTVIRAGTNSATISVTTYANGDADASETMTVVLDSVSYGTRANTSAIGTIYNTDVSAPRISIASTSANEGSDLVFTVSLLDGRVADRDITVSFHTTPGTASQTAGGDYYHSANGYGTTVIRTGTNSATISVTTYANGDTNASETMSVVLDSVSYGTRANTSAIGTIYNTDIVQKNPTATGGTYQLQPGESIILSDLFDYSDADNDIVAFHVRDREFGGGYLTKNDVKQSENFVHEAIPISEIGQWKFVAGPGGSTSTIGFNAIDSRGGSNPSAVATVKAALVNDDIRNDVTTQGRVNVGSSVQSNIDNLGDVDWFKVSLEAGKTYRFDLEGSSNGQGILEDPYLQLLNGSGKSLLVNDDTAGSFNSSITYKATTTGDFHLAVKTGATGNGTGGYRLSASDVTVAPPAPATDTVFDVHGGKLSFLAELANAAYSDTPVVAGLSFVNLSSAPFGKFVDFGTGRGFAFVGRTDDSLFLSFRGTDELIDVLDWPRIASIYQNFDPLIDEIVSFANNAANGIQNIYVTGHSLGAGMAQMFMTDDSARVSPSIEIESVTFANPGTHFPSLPPEHYAYSGQSNFWIFGDPITLPTLMSEVAGDKYIVYDPIWTALNLAKTLPMMALGGFRIPIMLTNAAVDSSFLDAITPANPIELHSMSLYLEAARFLSRNQTFISEFESNNADWDLDSKLITDIRIIKTSSGSYRVEAASGLLPELVSDAYVAAQKVVQVVGDIAQQTSKTVVGTAEKSMLILDRAASEAKDLVIGSKGTALTVLETATQGLMWGTGFNSLLIKAGTEAVKATINALKPAGIADNTIYFEGGDGDDVLNGKSADRRIVADGGAGNDTLTGGSSDDYIIGGVGADKLDGGAGQNTVSYETSGVGVTVNLATTAAQQGGDAAGDTLRNFRNAIGSEHADTFTSSASGSLLQGLGGNDTLIAGAKPDALFGGAGDDTLQLSGSYGSGDVLDGGADSDTLRVAGTANLTLIGFDATASSIEKWLGNGKALVGTSAANSFDLSGLLEITGLQYVDGSSGNDKLIGSNFADDLRGGAGNDLLSGGVGDDYLSGGTGNDTLEGGDHQDVLVGGAGADVMNGGDGDDLFVVSTSEGLGDTFNGGAGINAIRAGGTANVSLAGLNAANSSIVAWLGNDKALLGTKAADVFDLSGLQLIEKLLYLDAGAGDDRIIGSDFAGDLRGGDGNDFIQGGSNQDRLTGGRGSDTFHFEAGWGADKITDFSVKSLDRISFSVDVFADFGAVQAAMSLQDLDADGKIDDTLITSGPNTISILNVLPTALTTNQFDFF